MGSGIASGKTEQKTSKNASPETGRRGRPSDGETRAATKPYEKAELGKRKGLVWEGGAEQRWKHEDSNPRRSEKKRQEKPALRLAMN